MSEAVIIAIIEFVGAALLGGGLVGLLMVRNQRRNVDADTASKTATADKTAAEAWAILADKLMAENARLTLRVEALEREQTNKDQRIDDLEAEVEELRAWIIKNGMTPPERKRRAAK